MWRNLGAAGIARLGALQVAETGIVLIAVNDAVLADSLRFSLELEGYGTRLCEPPFERAGKSRVCLLLDQDVFARLVGKEGGKAFGRLGLPTVLMVNQRTPRLLDNAKTAGVTSIIDEPVLGGVLLDTIRKVLETDGPFGGD